MDLWEDIQKLSEWEGIDFLGVADLAPARDFIMDTGGPSVACYPRCVSLGISLMDAIVDGLAERDRDGHAEHYRMHAYDVVNARLDLAASKVASLLQRNGHSALPMSRMVKAAGKPLTAVFSHKLGAHLAGLGWIGKSCMLVTPERGPRVRWASVLTDAPLKPTGTSMEQRCGDCTACVDICPVHTFFGRNFVEGEPREMRYDSAKCGDYLDSLAAAGKPRVCGLCLYVCPHGRRK